MYDWIQQLTPGQRVLDLCSGPGSFPWLELQCTAIQLDEDVDAFVNAAPAAEGCVRVFARSHSLPLAAASIDLVVCHHALEHVEQLPETLGEIRRVLKPEGKLFVSVPNGYGLCDGVYRFVFEGGGHVNRFRREELVDLVERAAGVRLVRWHRLYSSFVYLWRLKQMLEAPPAGLSPRLYTIAKLPPKFLTAAQRLLYSGSRRLDRLFGGGLSVYGWSLYFERGGGDAVETPGYINVCRYCGSGFPAAVAERLGRGKCRCPNCQAAIPYCAPFGLTE